MPSERQIEAFLNQLAQFQFYHCYWDGGCCGSEGSMKFLSGADSFLWTAEPYCRKHKIPMKFRAWLRNHNDGDPVARFGPPQRGAQHACTRSPSTRCSTASTLTSNCWIWRTPRASGR